jgi:murein DD-endopeptidase MepM/ murein hydrolase activator NlpD
MSESGHGFLYRLWFLVAIILVAANLALLSLQLSTSEAKSIHYTSNLPKLSINFKVTMAAVSQKVGHVANSTLGIVKISGQFVGQTARDSATSVAHGFIGSVVAMANLPSHVVDTLSNPMKLESFIRPAKKESLPVITPIPAPPVSQVAAQPTASVVAAVQVSSAAAQWPIHGAITTPFGASDLPFERFHTGIDISDGRVGGGTPIKPFKPGLVAEVIHSYVGLGNHVIIDHGGGLTSVYGHLYSIVVRVGQPVDASTVLGYEGSTGASTGAHLHFEIRTNGQPVNPRNFINGLP